MKFLCKEKRRKKKKEKRKKKKEKNTEQNINLAKHYGKKLLLFLMFLFLRKLLQPTIYLILLF